MTDQAARNSEEAELLELSKAKIWDMNNWFLVDKRKMKQGVCFHRFNLGLDFFTDTSLPWPWYVLRTAMGRYATGIFLFVLTFALIYHETPAEPFYSPSAKTWLLVLLTGPVLETIGMSLMIAIFESLNFRPLFICLSVGLIAGAYHVNANRILGFTWAWGFFVYTLCFLAWKKVSYAKAFFITLAVHATDNFIWLLERLAHVAMFGPQTYINYYLCVREALHAIAFFGGWPVYDFLNYYLDSFIVWGYTVLFIPFAPLARFV